MDPSAYIRPYGEVLTAQSVNGNRSHGVTGLGGRSLHRPRLFLSLPFFSFSILSPFLSPIVYLMNPL